MFVGAGLYMYDIVVKVHFRYLVSCWILVCTAHARMSSGTLAPPGEYDWTCGCLGLPFSTTQTAYRSAQPFLHSHGRNFPHLYNGRPFPKNCPFPWGIWTPSNLWFDLGPVGTHNQKVVTIGYAVFAQMTAACSNTLHWDCLAPSPQCCPFPWECSPPSPHSSLGPPESSSQTASPWIQPFLQDSALWQTDRPTDSQTDRQTTILSQ